MKRVSKLRPSDSTPKADVNGFVGSMPDAPPAGRRPRIFHNSYTRAGRRFVADGWAVKLQHQGQRRTFSLRAKNKAAAILEARAIVNALQTGGWVAALHRFPGQRKIKNEFSKTDVNYWRERLLIRRYHFPAAGGSDADLAVRVDHAGTGYWFPLGTPDVEIAAAKALLIYETAVNHGWEECCRHFPRELIIGFEWGSNPVLWTYATIYTMTDKGGSLPVRNPASARFHNVLVVEPDAGIRRALEWSINRQDGFCGAACDSVESFARVMGIRKPDLVLLNHNLAERLGVVSPGQIAVIRNGVPAVTYSVAVDGDQLFVSTPGGAEGYLIRRVKPERLLEPILGANGQADFSKGDLLRRVESYFKELLHPRSSGAAPELSRLTRRENEVLALLSKGCVDKEIAQALGISAWTVHGHIKSIFERLRVRTRTEAVIRYLEK